MKKMVDEMERFSKILDKVYLTVAIICLLLLSGSCIWQVVTRYFLGHSAAWTEEVARYSFIWANLVGAAACVRKRNNANVSLFHDLLPLKLKKWHNCVIHALFALFGILMIHTGYIAAMAQVGRTSPVANVPMSLVFASVVVSGVGVVLQSLNNLLQDSSKRYDQLKDDGIPQEVMASMELAGEVKD